MTRPDYTALGFTLTVADACKILQVQSTSEVYDLMRAGILLGLAAHRDGRSFILFHPDELTDVTERIQEEKLTHQERIVVTGQRVLRAYLECHGPLPEYDEALETQYPLLAGTDEGEAVYLRAGFVSEWWNGTDRGFMRPVTKSSVEATLRSIGAIRRRGMIAIADRGTNKQRWTHWWRLPKSFVDDEMPEFEPAPRQPGDKLSVDADGRTYLTPALGAE